jgi:protein SCO1/2
MTTKHVLVVLLAAMTATVGLARARRVTVADTKRPSVEAPVRPAAPSRLKQGDELPPFSLTAQDGRAFTAADLRGQLTAITFVYTRCPMVEMCPLIVKRFQQLQRTIEQDRTLKDVQLISITLDPAVDTPPVLDAYAKAVGAKPERWRFVTGDPAQVTRLTTAFSVHVEPNGVLIDHTLATALVDRDGRVVDIWRGNGWKVSEFVDGLRRAAGR